MNGAGVTFDEHGWHVEYVNGLQTAVAGIQTILDRCHAVEQERDQLRVALARVEALHWQDGNGDCEGCATPLTFTPIERCRTRAALAGEQP